MKTNERKARPDVKSIEYLSGRTIVECAIDQMFYETPKSWEIWNIGNGGNDFNIFRVIRISRKKIGWVTTY